MDCKRSIISCTLTPPLNADQMAMLDCITFYRSHSWTRGMCTLWRCRSTPSLPGITFRVTCSA